MAIVTDIQESTKKVNNHLIGRVRSLLTEEENAGLSDKDIFDLMSEQEYMAFLQGWLEGQGYNTVDLDCTKELNIHKR